MSDPFLDSIEQTLENGDVPQRVTNRHLLAAIRGIDEKLDTQGERITALEHYRTKINAYLIAAGTFWGVLITIINLWVL